MSLGKLCQCLHSYLHNYLLLFQTETNDMLCKNETMYERVCLCYPETGPRYIDTNRV